MSLGVILEAANDVILRSRLQPIARMAAMSLGTLTAAKILLRTPPRVTGDDFNPEAWAVLDARADELAAIYYTAVTDREEVPVPPTGSERPYLRLVRPARGVKWCPTPWTWTVRLRFPRTCREPACERWPTP